MESALAVISLPRPAGHLHDWDRRDLGQALIEIGQQVLAGGRHTAAGTIVVPHQRRTQMKVSIDLTGPGGKMWELDMRYQRLPPAYVAEIASVAQSYAFYIENMQGSAGSATPAYAVTFKYEAEGEELEGVAAPMRDVFKGTARKDNLLYSQAIEVQDAGIALLTQLQAGAHREIKSGQRK